MYQIPNAFQSTAAKVAAGRITMRQAAAGLCACNLLPSIDEDGARRALAPIIVDGIAFYKPGSIYSAFGCTWIMDGAYAASDADIADYELYYRWRYRAHVVDCPPGYKGARTVDAAIHAEWARA